MTLSNPRKCVDEGDRALHAAREVGRGLGPGLPPLQTPGMPSSPTVGDVIGS